jgi:predicted transcriptional regulator
MSVGNMISEMEKPESQIADLVYEKGDMLVEDVYKEINRDEFDVDAAIIRLVNEGKVMYKKDKQIHGPDGLPILLPTIGPIDN